MPRLCQSQSFLYIAVVILFVGMTTIGSSSACAAERVALVIGNGAYQRVPALPNPPNDSFDIARSLERLSFKVTQLRDANASQMRKAIIDFGRSAEGADMAVVFYAGHGMEVGGENWLIPTDAELRSDTDVESEAVSLRSISLQVSKARQLGLIILDACRNNPFAAKMRRSLRMRAVIRGLAPTEPTDNVLVAYAARDGTTANDGDGRNSPFTAALLHNLETPGLEISFLFRNVRDEVMSATKREQQPFVYGSLSKEAIYLKSATAKPTPNLEGSIQNKPETQSAANSPNQTQGAFTSVDAGRVAAKASELKMKMPDYKIGVTKGNVPAAIQRFVGVWAGKRGYNEGQGRQAMLIVTEASDDLLLGYYLFGPPQSRSWTKEPAGYFSFAGRVLNGSFEFRSGNTVWNARAVGNNGLTIQVAESINKTVRKSRIALVPVWKLTSDEKSGTARR